MIRNFFLSITNNVKVGFSHLINLPAFLKKQKENFYQALTQFKYSLHNLTEVNMRLGIYHMHNRNFTDAVFRFKLVDRLWNPGNLEANYLLGWVYFLKNNTTESIKHLIKAQDKDQINLLSFIKKIDGVEEVPEKIYSFHREISATFFIDEFLHSLEEIPKNLIIELNQAITALPDQYDILELGSNIGILGSELRKRMQSSYSLTGIEVALEMSKLQPTHFPELQYDQIITLPIEKFFRSSENKYHIIVSFIGFSYYKSLQTIFLNIYNHLHKGGYFAFCLRTSPKLNFSRQYLEFAYNTEEIVEDLTISGFKLLSQKNLMLEIKNNYSIFVCVKE